MVDDVIFILLNQSGSITGTVANNIFPVVGDENNAEKYITVTRISTTPTNTKDGKSKLDVVRVQINVFAPNKADVDTVAENVRTKLDHYRGTVGAYEVDKIWLDDEHGDYNADMEKYFVVADYFIRHKRP